MIQKIKEKLKEINWTSLLIGVALGSSAYYLYQKYSVEQTERIKNKPLRV